MKYVKTFEQAEEFYDSNIKKSLIVTTDEKYVLWKRDGKLLWDPKLYPIEEVKENITKFLLGANPKAILDKLNNFQSERNTISKYYSQKGMYSGRLTNEMEERDGFILIFDEPYNKDNMFKSIEYHVGYQRDSELNL